jgi:hypothetical protein
VPLLSVSILQFNAVLANQTNPFLHLLHYSLVASTLDSVTQLYFSYPCKRTCNLTQLRFVSHHLISSREKKPLLFPVLCNSFYKEGRVRQRNDGPLVKKPNFLYLEPTAAGKDCPQFKNKSRQLNLVPFLKLLNSEFLS